MKLFYFGIAIILAFSVFNVADALTCDFYNQTQCGESAEGAGNCNKTEDCGSDPRSYCFASWVNNTENNSSSIKVWFKGCFHHDDGSGYACINQTRCVDKSEEKKQHKYCCCEGDHCNEEFFWQPLEPKPVAKAVKNKDNPLFFYLILPMCVLCLGLLALYWAYSKKKIFNFSELPTLEPQEQPPSPNLGLRPIELIEMKARGRFGCVWKAKLKTDIVAVKIFSPQDKQQWLTELEIFKLSNMDHENILHFIGAEKHGDNLGAEFWLITTFHEKGSLLDFLKSNTVTWEQVCKIAYTMARGLSHLHDVIPGNKSCDGKPSIAHRDFKSSNVLLTSDLAACIADFDLALIFTPDKECSDIRGQVGTRRYWAPEVLDGAINFSHSAFLKIDIYACGLVLWELASRCTISKLDITIESSEYKLPYEAEVGAHPSLEEMQECVVFKKQRPLIPEAWRDHKGMAELSNTIEECWDHDTEARISAATVTQRMAPFAQLSDSSHKIDIDNFI